MLGKAIEAKDVEFGCRTEIDTRTGSAAQEIDGRSATAGTQRDGDREELERNARNAGRLLPEWQNTMFVQIFVYSYVWAKHTVYLYPVIGSALRLLNVPAQQKPVCKDV